MAAYTGKTQRLEPPNDPTLLSHLLFSTNELAIIQASYRMKYRIWAFDAARRYLTSARLLLEEYRQFQKVAEHFPDIELPTQLTVLLREVQQ